MNTSYSLMSSKCVVTFVYVTNTIIVTRHGSDFKMPIGYKQTLAKFVYIHELHEDTGVYLSPLQRLLRIF